MSVIRNLEGGGLVFWCPGCDRAQALNTNPSVQWSYNGDVDKPTFRPSILQTLERPSGKEVCHSFVTDGRIQFLGDCTHALAGQTVDLPEWPYAPGTYGGIEEAHS